jgi:hypothetical protein
MTDQRKDFAIPIFGMKRNDPFAPKDDAFIRDVTAVNFGVNIRTAADLMALLGEEKHFCDLCGREFPMWPIRQWAAHYVHDHHDAITLQQQGAVAMLVTDELTPGVQQWFGMQLLSRTAIRRRAYDLGLIKWLPPNDAGRGN